MENISFYKQNEMYKLEYLDKFMNNKDEIHIYYSIKKINNCFERLLQLVLKNGDIIGEFGISGTGMNNQFDSGETNSLTISIEDKYQGFGYSKIMIKYMIDMIYNDIPFMNGEQMLFIDADASDGYWDRIGMKESKRYGYNRIPRYVERDGAGYEKYITINDIYKFARF
jgi:hypothetical protein